MSALMLLPTDWKNWINDNFNKKVPANKIAANLYQQGWVDAAYELMNKHIATLEMPYISTASNQIQLSDKKVSIAFTCYKPFITIINDFLTQEECQAVINDADSKLQTSRVVNPEDGSFIEHTARTSTSTSYQRGQTAIVKKIEARIANLLNWPVEHGEGLQVLRYEDGGEYRPHFDFFDPAKQSSSVVTARGGQRLGTFLMYLSDVEDGGSTRFPNLGFEVHPKIGTALYFANTDLMGDIDPQTLHAGLPVTKGVKYLATKWLRQYPYV